MSIEQLWSNPWIQSATWLTGSFIAALIARTVVFKFLKIITSKTTSTVDDRLVSTIRRPVMLSVLLFGTSQAIAVLTPPDIIISLTNGIIKTIVVLLWSSVVLNSGSIILDSISNSEKQFVQTRTLPLFQMMTKILVFSFAFYFVLIAWGINVTTWLASAGVVGIAVGFAAKDTLANLFSGVFILADAPYKIGDFIVLDNNLRGKVTDIGIRSTRLLTLEDVEVTIPNAVIGNSRIINQTGGPREAIRVTISVSVAYGSDIDQVREVLLSCSEDMDKLDSINKPRVRFRLFGASGLDFDLLCWINQPRLLGQVTDELNCKVYKALNAANIEIPYTKQDIYIKEMPDRKSPRL
jgi:MscS family membrane protein